MIRNSIKLACVTMTLAIASVASAGPWTTPAGSQTHFDYNNGQTTTGQFGTGNSTGSGFFFTPVNFVASGTPLDTQSDTISVILNAKPNQMFTSISSSILGDYSLFGVAGAGATGTLTVTNLDTSTALSSPLTFNGLPAFTQSSLDGGWDGATALALPAGWTNIKVELNASLQADGSDGGVALIQAKDGEIGVQTAEVPLPAAALVAPVLGYIGWRAKRKFAK